VRNKTETSEAVAEILKKEVTAADYSGLLPPGTRQGTLNGVNMTNIARQLLRLDELLPDALDGPFAEPPSEPDMHELDQGGTLALEAFEHRRRLQLHPFSSAVRLSAGALPSAKECAAVAWGGEAFTRRWWSHQDTLAETGGRAIYETRAPARG
jgi:hypothetical protein